MKFPFLTLFLIFIIILTIRLRSTDGREEKLEEKFWERERKANFTRKKDIENLPYIAYSSAALPLHEEIEDLRVREYIDSLRSLDGKRILNCTGYSNTDLKLKYGAANITKLSEYDERFTTLVRDSARLAEKYLLYARLKGMENLSSSDGQMTEKAYDVSEEAAAELERDARTLLEYGVEVGSDVRLCYELLGEMYAGENNYGGIEKLKEKAGELKSLSSQPIIRALEEIMNRSLKGQQEDIQQPEADRA